MKKTFISIIIAVGFATLAGLQCLSDSGKNYINEVVEPTLTSVLSVKWTAKGPDVEAIAAACSNVDWRVVRKMRSRQREVWIGGTDNHGMKWRLCISRMASGMFILDGRLWPFAVSPSELVDKGSEAKVSVVSLADNPTSVAAKMDDAKKYFEEAYQLRKMKKFPEASKTLRKAQMLDPLDVLCLVERNFLEDDGEGIMEVAAEGRVRPREAIAQCREAYVKIGATNEVGIIDAQLKTRPKSK